MAHAIPASWKCRFLPAESITFEWELSLSVFSSEELWPKSCFTIFDGDLLETILVVEDDTSILMLVQKILQDSGFEVLVASSGKKAMGVEAHFSGAIHLLLSDIMMPDICGPDLAGVLKKRRPEMRVMLMSGFADGAMLVLNHGWHFIEKPFLPSALLASVLDLLHTTVRDQGTHGFDPRQ